MLIVGGVIVASGLLYLVSRPLANKSELQTNNSSVNQQQPTTAVPKSSSSPAPKASSSAPVKVTVSLTDESWLRVVEDGKTKFEGTLTKGTQQTWSAKKQLTIIAGNAGAVLVSSNGQKQKPLGDLNDVKEVTFTSDKKKP